MKVFKVTGFLQYKTDCARDVERTQVANSIDDALGDVEKSYELPKANYKYKFYAVEVRE